MAKTWGLRTMMLYILIRTVWFSHSGICRFDRGNRYWNGKPQPIGIDLGLSEVLAVYAHSRQNFSTLGALPFDLTRSYYKYMYDIFAQKTGQPTRVDDDHLYHEESIENGFELQEVLREKFITSVVKILQEIKNASLTNHNITITSAIISKPEWMYNEDDDMIDEACLRAGIEVFEQPSPCVNMAAKTAKDHGLHDQVLALQLNSYGLNIYHRGMTPNTVHESSSVSHAHLGVHKLYDFIAGRVIQASNNATSTDENVAWASRSISGRDVKAVQKATWKIKNDKLWEEDRDVELRLVDLNLTDAAGEIREYTLRGSDLMEVEQRYSSLVSDEIEFLLWDGEVINKYRKGHPDFDRSSQGSTWLDYRDMIRRFVETVPTPPGIMSWKKHVDAVVVLDTTGNSWPLLRAANTALKGPRSADGESQCPNRILAAMTDPAFIAAIGAAIRALEWVGYWEDDQKWARYYNQS